MKPETSFIAERTLAAHCEQLLGKACPEPDLSGPLAAFGERLARPLALSLSRLAGFALPRVAAGEVRSLTMAEFADADGAALACIALAAGPGRASRVYAVMDAASILALLDHALGGSGAVPDPLPDVLPLSAELFLVRLEAALAEALACSLDEGADTAVTGLERGTSPARVFACVEEEPLVSVEFAVEPDAGEALALRLAFRKADAAAMFARAAGDGAQGTSYERNRGERESPCLDIPLPLSATLVDMPVRLSRISGLAPGDILPVSLARSVPVRVRDRVIAHGAVGEIDERVALRITRAF